MDIRNVFSNRHLIPEEYHENFSRKRYLCTVEKLGLEAILVAFIHQYEHEEYGEVFSDNLTNFTRNNDSCVDILDGVFDTYIFDNYAISEIWMTESGIPMLSCFLLESDEYSDPFDIVRKTDWTSDCKHVLFRLD